MSSLRSRSPVSSGSDSSAAVVGREREWEMLRERVDQLLGGSGGLILVSGVAGIGKTTLVSQTLNELRDRGGLALTGHCYDLTVTPPYGPWVDLLRSYVPEDGFPPLPDALQPLLPGQQRDQLQSQTALFQVFCRFLTDISNRTPLVVVLEDLHWADPGSLELLRYLARETAGQPILLLVTYRDDEVTVDHPMYQHRLALVRETGAVRLDLRGLSADALVDLARDRYALAAGDLDRLGAWLRRLSEGNPFYAHELLHALEAQQVLAHDGDVWVLRGEPRDQLPALLRQMVEMRLARLDDAVRQSLQVAAMIGEDVPFDLWTTVSGRSFEELIDDYEQALELRLVTESADGAGFRFSHALLRQALYDSVASLRRRVWHLAIADAMAQRPSPDPDAVAYHYQRAGETSTERAISWLVRAGDRAQRAYAWRTAVERFEAAARALDAYPERAVQRGWLLFRVGALHRFSDVPRAISSFEQAVDLARQAGDATLHAYASFAWGSLLIHRGAARSGLPIVERAINDLMRLPMDARERLNRTPGVFNPNAVPEFDSLLQPQLPSDPDPARVFPGDIDRQGVLALLLATLGYARRSLDIVEDALDAMRKLPADGEYDHFIGHLNRARGYALALLGSPPESMAAFEASWQAFDGRVQHLQHLQSIVAALDTTMRFYLTDDRQRRAELVATAHRVGVLASDVFPAGLSYEHTLLHEMLLHGEWNRVASLAAVAEPGAGQRLLIDGVRSAAASLAREQGHHDDAWRHIRAVLPEGPRTEPGDAAFVAAVDLQRCAVAMALDTGDITLAEAWAEAHARWLSWSGSTIHLPETQLLRAEIALARGEHEMAATLAEEGLALAISPRQPLALLALHRLLGHVAMRSRDYRKAASHMASARALATAIDAPAEIARVQIAEAERAIHDGRLDDARRLLRDARAFCDGADAVIMRREIERITADLAVREGRITYPAGLSPREVEVLRLVAGGMTDAETADALSISPRTVGQHLRSIYNKLGVSSRVAASRFAIEHGLV